MSRSPHLLKKIALRFARLIREARGQDIVEYALLTGFFAVAARATLPPVADSIDEIFGRTERILKKEAGTNDHPNDREPVPPTQEAT